jgi:CO dehydrogenase/acetyl-CoA synthase beta subunit
MRAFDEDLRFLRELLERGEREGRVRRLVPSDPSGFLGEEPQLVLREEAWVELGSPELPSLASVLLTETPGLVRDGGISLIGEDLPGLRGEVPFAQLCLVESREIRDEDYRRLSLAPFRLRLRGYMVRSLPSQMRIWSRVSEEAVRRGFSFSVLGEALRLTLRSAFPVSSVEVVFSTSPEGVRELWGMGEKAGKVAGAVGKMVEEVSLDCERCDYREVCGSVPELRRIRERKLREVRG